MSSQGRAIRGTDCPGAHLSTTRTGRGCPDSIHQRPLLTGMRDESPFTTCSPWLLAHRPQWTKCRHLVPPNTGNSKATALTTNTPGSVGVPPSPKRFKTTARPAPARPTLVQPDDRPGAVPSDSRDNGHQKVGRVATSRMQCDPTSEHVGGPVVRVVVSHTAGTASRVVELFGELA